MGTQQAYRPDDPWTVREIVEAAVYVVGAAVAILVLLYAAGVLLTSMDRVLP